MFIQKIKNRHFLFLTCRWAYTLLSQAVTSVSSHDSLGSRDGDSFSRGVGVAGGHLVNHLTVYQFSEIGAVLNLFRWMGKLKEGLKISRHFQASAAFVFIWSKNQKQMIHKITELKKFIFQISEQTQNETVTKSTGF